MLARERVVLAVLARGSLAPFRGEQPVALQPVEQGIKGALFPLELRAAPCALDDLVPVERAVLEERQDQRPKFHP